MKFNFQIKRGYIVYKDGAGVVLFDTGCVRTVFSEQDIQGELFPKVHKFVDSTVNKIIGMDLISRQPVFIDYPKKELVFGGKTTVVAPVAKYDLDVIAPYGLLAVSLKIGGQKRKMLLDIGAATSYLLKSFVTQGKPAGKVEDFYISEPDLFETDTFLFSTECGERLSVVVKYGVPKDSIRADIENCRVDGIIGYEWLRRFKVLLDVPNRCLALYKADDVLIPNT